MEWHPFKQAVAVKDLSGVEAIRSLYKPCTFGFPKIKGKSDGPSNNVPFCCLRLERGQPRSYKSGRRIYRFLGWRFTIITILLRLTIITTGLVHYGWSLSNVFTVSNAIDSFSLFLPTWHSDTARDFWLCVMISDINHNWVSSSYWSTRLFIILCLYTRPA